MIFNFTTQLRNLTRATLNWQFLQPLTPSASRRLIRPHSSREHLPLRTTDIAKKERKRLETPLGDRFAAPPQIESERSFHYPIGGNRRVCAQMCACTAAAGRIQSSRPPREIRWGERDILFASQTETFQKLFVSSAFQVRLDSIFFLSVELTR